ncbi:phytanoyl-CoA dioxygenase family protein [uncultured Devosia sp.]|uniref:phytanoyl-CoA dioxygenase family protein n=1 Tax=uncultured Devosia sp. TaxID=211434 RepID=UPI0035CB713B
MPTAELHQSPSLPALHSNGVPLSNAPSRLGWLPATRPTTPMPELRRQFHEQGCLLVKGLLPRADILSHRAEFFAFMAAAGILEPGTDPADGICRRDPQAEPLARKLLMEWVRSARYEKFCMHERLVGFMDDFLEGLSYLHKRKIIRYTRPRDAASTGAHYDLVYIRGGTERLVTAWIPIGDVPVHMGGLVYLEGSHTLGRTMEAEFAAANADLTPDERVSAYNKNMAAGGWLTKNLAELADKFDARWLMADYEAGDVMLHSPYMIHAATANEATDGRMRLSTDIRYQRVSDEIDARWANHWSLDDML